MNNKYCTSSVVYFSRQIQNNNENILLTKDCGVVYNKDYDDLRPTNINITYHIFINISDILRESQSAFENYFLIFMASS